MRQPRPPHPGRPADARDGGSPGAPVAEGSPDGGHRVPHTRGRRSTTSRPGQRRIHRAIFPAGPHGARPRVPTDHGLPVGQNLRSTVAPHGRRWRRRRAPASAQRHGPRGCAPLAEGVARARATGVWRKGWRMPAWSATCLPRACVASRASRSAPRHPRRPGRPSDCAARNRTPAGALVWGHLRPAPGQGDSGGSTAWWVRPGRGAG